uniref:PKD_channel domain-containing protein n=1 Tax=Steinernema glaseri TaxID=37863 RepID=A0A1I7ZTF5_9BILA
MHSQHHAVGSKLPLSILLSPCLLSYLLSPNELSLGPFEGVELLFTRVHKNTHTTPNVSDLWLLGRYWYSVEVSFKNVSTADNLWITAVACDFLELACVVLAWSDSTLWLHEFNSHDEATTQELYFAGARTAHSSAAAIIGYFEGLSFRENYQTKVNRTTIKRVLTMNRKLTCTEDANKNRYLYEILLTLNPATNTVNIICNGVLRLNQECEMDVCKFPD